MGSSNSISNESVKRIQSPSGYDDAFSSSSLAIVVLPLSTNNGLDLMGGGGGVGGTSRSLVSFVHIWSSSSSRRKRKKKKVSPSVAVVG